MPVAPSAKTVPIGRGEKRAYLIRGQVVFALSEALVVEFFREPLGSVRLDLSHAQFCDITAIEALDRIVNKFAGTGLLLTL
jgi:SulP family sulfate permease